LFFLPAEGEDVECGGGDEHDETCDFDAGLEGIHLPVADMPCGHAPEGYFSAWPEEVDVGVIEAVYQDVEPDAEDAGDEHFRQGCVVRQSQQTHGFFKDISEGIGGQGPSDADGCADEQRVLVAMDGVVVEDEDFDVNEDVGQDEDRQVERLLEDQPNKSAGSEMIWGKRHERKSLNPAAGVYIHQGFPKYRPFMRKFCT